MGFLLVSKNKFSLFEPIGLNICTFLDNRLLFHLFIDDQSK